MSTTESLEVAMIYSASEHPVLLRLECRDWQDHAPDISFLSAFPHEKEYLFPPRTTIKPVNGRQKMQKLQVGEKTITIINVYPNPGQK